MLRKIIQIDEKKCTGCGLCANACHEGAIGLRDGKAQLLRDDFCDGLGDCLPACPENAIRFVLREALPYDEAAVQKTMKERSAPDALRPGELKPFPPSGGIPERNPSIEGAPEKPESALRQWPVQIRLAPQKAPFFTEAHLLVAADCTAFAHGAFHRDFMSGSVTLIGCPKLDSTDYAERLAAIVKANTLASLTVARMSVPCCGGLEQAAAQALRDAGKDIPFRVVTIGIDGSVQG